MKFIVKAFTLIELVVVMAIFSMIMFGAVMLINPVRDLFKSTGDFVSARAAMDNVSKYFETTLRNANRMHIYVGWNDDWMGTPDPTNPSAPVEADYAGIQNSIDVSKEWATEKVLGSAPVDIYRTWGRPQLLTPTNPQEYFFNNFLLGGKKTLTYTWDTYLGSLQKPTWTDSSNLTYDVVWTHTMEIDRSEVDTSLTMDKLTFNVLEILRVDAGGTDTNGDGVVTNDGTIQAVNLYTAKYDSSIPAWVYTSQTPINPIYFQNYDFRLVFGEFDIDENGVALAADPITTIVPDDYKYKTEGDNKFFNTNRWAMSISAKPKPTPKEPYPTYLGANLTMVSSISLQNTISNGLPKTEEVSFNVITSKAAVSDLIHHGGTNHGGPTEIAAADAYFKNIINGSNGVPGTNLNPLDNSTHFPAGFGVNAFPIYREHNCVDYAPMAAKGGSNVLDFEDCWNNETPPRSTFISPSVPRYEIFYNYNLKSGDVGYVAPDKQLKFAETENVHIIFTLPKTFVNTP